MVPVDSDTVNYGICGCAVLSGMQAASQARRSAELRRGRCAFVQILSTPTFAYPKFAVSRHGLFLLTSTTVQVAQGRNKL